MSPAPKKPRITSEEGLAAARSWKGKLVKDAYEQKFGVVSNVRQGDDGLFILTANFQGESAPREFLLGEADDINRLMPGDIEARYRPLTPEDEAELKRRAANNAG